MCAAALILAGVEQVVYAVGVDAVALHLELPEDVVVPGVTGAAIFDSTAEGPEVVGPILESEALSRIEAEVGCAQAPPSSRPEDPRGRRA